MGVLLDRLPDRRFNRVGIAEHVDVRETQHPKPTAAEPGIPLTVIRSLLRQVLAAIDFHHKPSFEAEEVDNVWAKWLLSAKLVASEATLAD